MFTQEKELQLGPQVWFDGPTWTPVDIFKTPYENAIFFLSSKRSSCYFFGALAIVSVICCIVLLKGIEPYGDVRRAAT